MRKISYIILFFPLLVGCSVWYSIFPNDLPVDKELLNFAEDIAEHPEKIKNLGKYYPQYYNPDWFYKKLLDSNYIEDIIKYINQYVNKNGCGYSSFRYQKVQPFINDYQQRFCKCKIDSNSQYSFFLYKMKIGLDFHFLKNDNKYFLMGIFKNRIGIDDPD